MNYIQDQVEAMQHEPIQSLVVRRYVITINGNVYMTINFTNYDTALDIPTLIERVYQMLTTDEETFIEVEEFVIAPRPDTGDVYLKSYKSVIEEK